MSKTKTELFPILLIKNRHERDKNIEFFEIGHKYLIKTDPTSTYTSVTTWNHTHFPHFNADEIIKNMMKGKSWKEGHKYWGLTAEQIKNLWNTNRDSVAGAGTDLHYEIECFMNNQTIAYPYYHYHLYEKYLLKNRLDLCVYPYPETKEWDYFIQFIKDHPHLKPYRTEWTIYHEELKLSGSIDMVYENTDGTLSIYDWKRSKDITRINPYNKYAITECISHMPDSNFWHYALQLNTYKAILEDKYGKTIKDLYLVRLHPDNDDHTYELINIPILKNEIKDLFEKRSFQINNH